MIITRLHSFRFYGLLALADDFLGGLVVAKADEARMTEFVVAGPFREADLCDEFGCDPMDAAPWEDGAGDRRDSGFKPSKVLAQTRQGFSIISGANFACVDQVFAAVKANQERAEAGPLPFGIGVADNDEFLLLHALEFQPVARPARHIQGLGIFCDHTFPSKAARVTVVGLSLGVAVAGESERVAKLERPAKEFFTMSERQLPCVVLIEIDQVEQAKPHRDAANQLGGRVLNLHALLEQGEARDVTFEGNDFAVKYEVGGALAKEGFNQFWVSLVKALTVAGKEAQVAAATEHEATLSVELFLE